MIPVNFHSPQTPSTPITEPKGLMAEVQALEKAITDYNLPRIHELSQSLVNSGRMLAIKHVQKKEGLNPLPIAENLFKSLASSNLQWEDETRHLLSKPARLFLELACMKSVNENKEIYSDTKENLRTQIDKLLDHAREDQVGLRYELTCSSEALKLMEQFDTKKYLQTFVGALGDMSLSSVPNLLSLIPGLISNMHSSWFPEALYLSWTGTMVRDNLPLFESHCTDIAKRLDNLEISQTAVEFFGDLVWHGSPEISLKALTGTPGLISLASQQGPKRTIFNFPTKMWPVRYRAIQILSTLIDKDPEIARRATDALLNCNLRETNPKVRKLLEKLEKEPEIKRKWKEQFELKKSEIFEQNVKEREEFEKQYNLLKEREQSVLEKTSANQLNSQQLAQEKKEIEQQRQYVEELRQESLAHRDNAEMMHTKMMKGINQLLDAVLTPQVKVMPQTESTDLETVQPHFKCPLTKDIMVDPVIADDGESYERSAIEHWFSEHNTSPITNLPISKKLISNRRLRDAIEHYKTTTTPLPAPTRTLTTEPPTPDTNSANPGNATAQYNLGLRYANGRGVKKDAGEAIKWYRAAAEQGHVLAQFNLAVCYNEGFGVPQDDKEAVKWYTKAADQNHSSAQYYLGLRYTSGRGVPIDENEAFKWCSKAAENGYATAQYNLGIYYSKGQGIPQDPDKTIKWYKAAAEQGHILAQFNLAVCYNEGFGVPQDDKEAAKWYTKAADQNHASAQYYLGLRYASGRGVPQDDKEAFKWYKKAAENGHVKAQSKLAICYSKGRGVERDENEASKWYKMAAENGSKPAQKDSKNE